MNVKELLKNRKIMIAMAALLLIVIVVIIIVRKKKSGESDGGITGGTSNGGGSSLPLASFPLTPYSRAGEYSPQAGSYGQQIANLQKICNEKFGKNLDVDGKYGPKSENAFMNCFGSPFAPPYSEEVYNGFIITHGQGIV